MATDNRMDEEYRIVQQRLADAETELLGMALFLAQQSGLAEAITRNDTTFIQRTIDNTVLRFHPRAVIITAPRT